MLINGELVAGELAAGLEVGGADEEVVVDHAVQAGRRIICGKDLVPDVRRIGGSHQAGFLAQLTAQGGQLVLTWFYAATRSSPDGRCSIRDRRVRKEEAA
ncbi:hypothetical protein Afe04nite_33140 [Asanoa ferruginea]|nr:hypothetical protein Afe04nite_33140 [Asanoa ferruginea]